MADLNLFDSQGSSIKATTKLDALRDLFILANLAEARRNRNNINNQTNFTSYTITSDAQTLMTGTINIPSTMVENATTGDIDLVPDEPFSATYYPFTAGAGDLKDAAGPMAAMVRLAKKCTYLEKQIDPNIVVTRADQITVVPDVENGNIAVTVNLPIDVNYDEATGATQYNVFDYLRILSFQAA